MQCHHNQYLPIAHSLLMRATAASLGLGSKFAVVAPPSDPGAHAVTSITHDLFEPRPPALPRLNAFLPFCSMYGLSYRDERKPTRQARWWRRFTDSTAVLAEVCILFLLSSREGCLVDAADGTSHFDARYFSVATGLAVSTTRTATSTPPYLSLDTIQSFPIVSHTTDCR